MNDNVRYFRDALPPSTPPSVTEVVDVLGGSRSWFVRFSNKGTNAPLFSVMQFLLFKDL